MLLSKRCATCGISKKLEQFHRSKGEKLGVEYQCKKCAYIRQKKRRQLNWEKILEHYNAKCFCCGEVMKEFRTIDHVNGDGANHRREKNRGILYSTIIKEQFPKKFRIACMNCNFAMGVHGHCPHRLSVGR